MLTYILRRVILMVPTLIGVSLVVFSVMHMLPGDIVLQMLQEVPNYSQENVDLIRARLGLDQPAHIQYLTWMSGVIRGDLGTSLWTGQSVTAEVLARLPVSLELGLMTILVGTVAGVFFGVLSAIRRDSWIDYLVRIISIAGLSIPGFLIATLLVVFPAVYFGYMAPIRYVPIWEDPVRNLQQFLLPSFALGLTSSASIMRISRSTMLEVMRQDYVRTAWAKGLNERNVIIRHALKNAMIPVVTLIGDRIALVVGGSVIIESIFALPGVGRMVQESLVQRDLVAVQGVVMFFAVIVLVVNLVVDVSYAWFDPRIRFGSGT